MENSLELAGFARRLRIGTLTVAAFLVAITLIGALVPAQSRVHVDAGGLPHGWAVALALVTVALIVLALSELARMLKRIEQGERFGGAVTRHFRGFALWLLVAAVARVVLPAIAELVLAVTDGAGKATLDLDDGDMILMLVSAVLFFVARLFDEAARFEDDSRSIV